MKPLISGTATGGGGFFGSDGCSPDLDEAEDRKPDSYGDGPVGNGLGDGTGFGDGNRDGHGYPPIAGGPPLAVKPADLRERVLLTALRPLVGFT